jgi:hypothetical protein
MSRGDSYTRADTRRLVEMMRDGCAMREIAEALNRSEHSVRVKSSRIRRMLDLPRGNGREYRLTLIVTGAVLHALHLHAESRGKTAPILAAELLGLIVKDDLFKAVLGDDQ